MTRITPHITNSVTMIVQNEEKHSNLETFEIKDDVNMRSCLKDLLFQIARPLILSMSLFGLLHLSGKERRWAPITKIYSTIVLLLMWAMFIRSFTLYGSDGFGPNLIFKMIMHSWIFLCAAAATSTYMACRRQNRLVEFLTRWSNLLKLNRGCGQAFEDVNTDRYVRKTKRSFILCLILSWLVFFASCGSLAYMDFKANGIDFLIGPMDPSHPQALLLKCLLYVVLVYMCAACTFMLCLFYNIGSVIYEEFRIFHMDFQKAVRQNGDIVGLETYRRRHQEICLLVENADDILSGFSAVGIVSPLVFGMLVLYSFLGHSDQLTDLVMLMSNIYWLLFSLVYLGVIAVGGGYLNHMAHGPFKTIHNIQLKTISKEISLQMTMFLSKLTGESIGLTVMGMFVIDKPTILTIVGAFLTYFVVLVQFKQPSGQQEVYANCTASIA